VGSRFRIKNCEREISCKELKFNLKLGSTVTTFKQVAFWVTRYYELIILLTAVSQMRNVESLLTE
jgi:hypothetical protein